MGVSVGDLVCLYRRKNKGFGLVLEKVDDLPHKAGLSHQEIMGYIKTKPDWKDLHEFKKARIDQSRAPELAGIYFAYHTSWAAKEKKSFVKIRWFKQPSAWESPTREVEAWYPVEWIRKV